MPDEVLIKAENIGKKYCRSLKRSLWYGVKDIARDINPFSGNEENQEPGTRNQAQGTRHKAQETRHQAPALRADEFCALQNISFELKRGECLGLIGHNGAGKSTLLKILNGLIRPDTGKLTMRGRVGALIELSAGFNPILTGRENIYNRGALLGFTRSEIDRKFDEIVDFAEIGEFLDMPVQNYSSGMQVRLGFAVSAQMEPDVLILDEVLAVGDVAFRMKCVNRIGQLMRNSAVVFVSHSMPEIHRVSNKLLLLDHGSPIYHGSDVAEGVRIYFSHQNLKLEDTTGGSGEIEMVDISVAATGEPSAPGHECRLHHGDSVEITLQLKFLVSISSIELFLTFWNEELFPVFEVRVPEVSTSEFTPGEPAQIKVKASRLPMNAGKYQLGLNIAAPDGRSAYLSQKTEKSIVISLVSASGALCVGLAEDINISVTQ